MNAASRAAHLDFAGPPSLAVQRPANQNPASRKPRAFEIFEEPYPRQLTG
jgi:hypothetical protein